MTVVNELTYNATVALLPDALVVNYAYGAVELGTNPIVTLEKQPLNVIGNLV